MSRWYTGFCPLFWLYGEIQIAYPQKSNFTVQLGPNAREIECLEWLGRALRVDDLGIGVPTVATHLSGARKTLGAATRERALVLALRHGLIDP